MMYSPIPAWFLASDSDRQRPEGQSFGLQQSKGKPAESGEEECVSKTAVISTDVCGHSGRVAVVVVLVSSLLGFHLCMVEELCVITRNLKGT